MAFLTIHYGFELINYSVKMSGKATLFKDKMYGQHNHLSKSTFKRTVQKI